VREKRPDGYAGRVLRAHVLVAVALASALLGAVGALAIARAAGWIGENRTETFVVPAPRLQNPAPQPAGRSVHVKPVLGNGFDPARIYAARSPGVVTLFARFGGVRETQGSGFVVSEDGVILTNSHVISSSDDPRVALPKAADRVYVEFADRERLPAHIVGWDVFDDIGVLRVDPAAHRLDPVPLGSSASVRVGDPVAVIGSPFGNENSLAVGVVSATKRSIESLTSSYDLLDAIQTDAPINHGNSGGPVFDARGRVVGVAAQIRSASGNAEGVGFAVPIDSARRSLHQLLEDGKAHYAYVGIATETLTPPIARRFGFGARRGAIVTGVTADSPADAADIRPSSGEEEFNGVPTARDGDVVVAIDGVSVESAEDLVRIVTNRLLPGKVASFSVVRGGKRMTVALRLAERPPRLMHR
jgi:S1-C subfamily serine protease